MGKPGSAVKGSTKTAVSAAGKTNGRIKRNNGTVRTNSGPVTLRLLLLPCSTAIIALLCQAARGHWSIENTLLLSMEDIVSRGLAEHQLCLSDVVPACAVDGVVSPNAMHLYLQDIEELRRVPSANRWIGEPRSTQQ